MVKLAALLSIFMGLCFGLPCAHGIRYLSTTGEVWTFLGFPTYGGGPFEGIGIPTTVLLLVAFLVVCGLEVVTGWLLWRGLRAGAVLGVALLPFELAFWIGFALPSFVSGSRWRRVTPKERSAPNHTCQLRARTTDVKR
jgi:hypothetical protein